MKTFMRTYLISFLSFFLTQNIIYSFEFRYIFSDSVILFVLGLSLAHLFLFPILKVLSLPSRGLGGLLLRTLLFGFVIYISTSALKGISIVSSTLPSVSFLKYTLPSKSLNKTEALAASAISYSIISTFLIWLCKGKK